jgi:hypothetical protein
MSIYDLRYRESCRDACFATSLARVKKCVIIKVNHLPFVDVFDLPNLFMSWTRNTALNYNSQEKYIESFLKLFKCSR